jgi:hypothetical protein
VTSADLWLNPWAWTLVMSTAAAQGAAYLKIATSLTVIRTFLFTFLATRFLILWLSHK